MYSLINPEVIQLNSIRLQCTALHPHFRSPAVPTQWRINQCLNNHVSSRSSVRCFDHRSTKLLPVPDESYEAWVGPDKVNLTQQCCQIFLSWTLNSKATLGIRYTKAKEGTRSEVSLTQPWSHMLILPWWQR